MLTLLTIIFWLGSSVLVGATARQHGRSSFGWFLLAMVLSPLVALISLIFVPAMPAKKDRPLLTNPIGRMEKGTDPRQYAVEPQRSSSRSHVIGRGPAIRLVAASGVLVAAVAAGMVWHALPSTAGSRDDMPALMLTSIEPVLEGEPSIHDSSDSVSAPVGDSTTIGIPSEWDGKVLTVAILRSGPGTHYEIVGSLEGGAQVQVTGANRTKGWYRLQNGAWIDAALLSVPSGSVDMPVVSAPASSPISSATGKAPMVNASIANLRIGPGTSYPILGKVSVGQKLALVAVNLDGDWYQLNNGTWIYAQLVDNPPAELALNHVN